jgi:hypothetical protein
MTIKKVFKETIILVLFLYIIVGTVSAADFKDIMNCKDDCADVKTSESHYCLNIYDICKIEADKIMVECSSYTKKEKYTCLTRYRTELKICNDAKRACAKKVDSDFNRCVKICLYKDKNITCSNGRYKAGDVFLQDCNQCECMFNGKTSCKSTNYCNYQNISTNRLTCENNSGLYQQLCAGSLYSMKCTSEVYCQCGGNFDYKCPENYTCLKEFFLNMNKKGQFAQGWRKLPEIRIGDVGICVKNPILNNCGDGICENIVKDGKISETYKNCAQDCTISGENTNNKSPTNSS